MADKTGRDRQQTQTTMVAWLKAAVETIGTQAATAEVAGVSRRTMRRYVAGQSKPKPRTLQRIARASGKVQFGLDDDAETIRQAIYWLDQFSKELCSARAVDRFHSVRRTIAQLGDRLG